MSILYLKKHGTVFIPADSISAEAMEGMSNHEYKAELTRPRNYEFHKKFFALINVAFDAWEMPVNEYKGMQVHKNMGRFRKDLLIMAGYGYPVVTVRGDVRFEAQSISFGSMEQTEFEKLYSKVVDVILSKVLTNYSKSDLDEQVNRILQFT